MLYGVVVVRDGLAPAFNSFIKKQPTSSQLPWTNLHLPSAWQLRAADLLREPESYNSRITQLQLI